MQKLYMNLPRYRVGDLIPGAEALGLKRVGHSYVGPCPICGGTDRFSINHGKDGFAWVHCRKGCLQREIIQSLVGDGFAQNYRRAYVTNQTQAVPFPATDTGTRVRRAQEIWKDALPFKGDHPYLQRKRLSLQHLNTFKRVHSQQVQRYAAGLEGPCLVFPLSYEGDIKAVQLIDETGTKRTIGAPKGASFRYGIPLLETPILIGEGLATVASVANELLGCGYVTAGDWNIDPVITRIRALHKAYNHVDIEFIVLADIDKNGLPNPKAIKAAAKHRIKVSEARHVD